MSNNTYIHKGDADTKGRILSGGTDIATLFITSNDGNGIYDGSGEVPAGTIITINSVDDKFHINGSGSTQLFLENTIAATGGVAQDSPSLFLAGKIWNSAIGSMTQSGSINIEDTTNNANPSVSKLSFKVGTDDNAPTEQMSISSLGTFNIAGGANFDGTTLDDVNTVSIINSSGATSSVPQSSNKLRLESRMWNSSEGDIANSAYIQVLNTVNNNANTTNRIGFFTQDGVNFGSYTEQMSISNKGNVGIGTTTPSYNLDVTGSTNAGGIIYSAGTNLSDIFITSNDGVVSGATMNSDTLELSRTEGLGIVTVDLSQFNGAFTHTATGIITPTNAYGNTVAVHSPYSSIVGGEGNTISGASGYSTIGGGQTNEISDSAKWSFIGSGKNNGINGFGYSNINSGRDNFISDGGYSTIGGGRGNQITVSNVFSTTIGGGHYNRASAVKSFIGGGAYNKLGGGLQPTTPTDGQYSFLGGGKNNKLYNSFSVIGGGELNQIGSPSDVVTRKHNTIGGGNSNTIGGYIANTIAGGENNTITGTGGGTIGGGYDNKIYLYSWGATIGGGRDNIINTGSYYGFIGCGNGNVIQTGFTYSTIIGGQNNIVNHSGAHIIGSNITSISANTTHVEKLNIGVSTGTTSVNVLAIDVNGMVVQLNHQPWTIELMDALVVDFYAPYALSINSVTDILNSPTITLLDDDVSYTLTNTIASGSKITVSASTASVVTLNSTY